MQCTFSTASDSICASCLRRLCVACEADQQVSLPFMNWATAQDGPIEPCVWMAKSYVAANCFSAFAIASAGLPTCEVTSSFAILVLRTLSLSLLWSGNPSHADQVALSLRAA